ncbi:MAG: c-type cytochrome [Acidobacteriota bacterium]|nr:c-type cytochrome [Acidobacteriota bacterium]
MRRGRILMLGAVALTLALSAPGLLAAGGQEPAPKNVKVLKGMTLPQIRAQMQLISQSLGQNCYFCHVKGNFASDENPHKLTARKMLEMTEKINADFFPGYKAKTGQNRITCFTCHNGTTEPKRVPPAPAGMGN